MNEAEVTDVIKIIKKAWAACSNDYQRFKINGEHCLQSALYYHLRKNLPKNHTILTEAYVGLPEGNTREKSHNRVDIIICKSQNQESRPEIALVGIELKFTPKGEPSKISMQKDFSSLSYIRNKRNKNDRIKILFKRHSTQYKADPIELKIHTHAKVFLGIFCKRESQKLESESIFWNHYRPADGHWENRARKLPRKLGILITKASRDNAVDIVSWGAAS